MIRRLAIKNDQGPPQEKKPAFDSSNNAEKAKAAREKKEDAI